MECPGPENSQPPGPGTDDKVETRGGRKREGENKGKKRTRGVV